MKAAVQMLAPTEDQTQGHSFCLRWEAFKDEDYGAFAQVGQGKVV